MTGVRMQKSGVRRMIKFALMMLAAGAIALSGRDASAMLTARANHDHITIDFFYHGSTVSVKGLSDPGRDLVIKIASPDGHQILKQKGKVAGMLWMNVGKLSFEKTPNLYEVFSTRPLGSILTREEQQRFVIGYQALANHVEISPVASEAEKAQWFNEFLKYQEASNLYVARESAIETTQQSDGHQQYCLMTQWPYQAAPGEYTVTVYAVKDGKVIEHAEAKVKVEQVGMVKTLASMAKDSAAFYGMLSIGIALGAGFGVGMIFRKGGGSH
jgi:uncharacterized protein (TIGR02186 family)